MDEQKKETTIPGFKSIEDFTKNGFKTLVDATKASNALPTDRNWDFYKVHNSFNRIMNSEGDRILRLMNNILHSQNVSAANIRNKDVEEKMEVIIEANDDILEKVAIGIDEMNGIKKNVPEAVEIQAVSAQLPVNGSWNQLNRATFSVTSSIKTAVNQGNDSLKSIRLLTAKNIVRPQSFFKDKIDNRNTPWVPPIKDKPNSLKPLAIFLEETEQGNMYSHPYEFELDRFNPLPEQLEKVKPVLPKTLEETPLHEITTPEQLEELLDELRKHKEFAVDLEHHSYRTFMGITCLMQISTKDADYLIDTLTLRDKLCMLNEVFTKPSIVKIFHGADSDVEWLQRDLSLYVVNLFDTHQAAKLLEYQQLSLAYLLRRFCSVTPNKHFQLADWRIRPLPEELKTYARMDTHFLLYIYQNLKNELLRKGNGSDNILKAVIQQSTQLCKKRYIKPILREESHLNFYRKCKRMFDNRQMYALKELYNWRDNLARNEDESTGYVLPNHMLLQISEALPREIQGILACCNPIPPLVRSNLIELHKIILKAREQSAIKPILKEDYRSRGSTLKFNKTNIDSPLNSPHDLSKMAEFRDDLPTLLGDMLKNASNKNENRNVSNVDVISSDVIKLEKAKSMYSVFNTPENSDDEFGNEAVFKLKGLTFLAPYERYKLVKPFIQAEEEKEKAEKRGKNEEGMEEKTTEDRIAALHAHFVKVSKETPQKLPEVVHREIIKQPQVTEPEIRFSQETLASMGGSKKRKRNDFDSDNIIELHPSYQIPDNELHTPVPKRKRFRKGKNKKQQNREQDNFKDQQQQQNQFGHPECSQLESQSNANQNNQPQQLDNNNPRPDNYKNSKAKRRDWFKKRQAMKKQRQMDKKPQNNQKQQQNQQSNQQNEKNYNFEPFDYSKVDFQEFQGNAGFATSKNPSIKARFKGKNKNKKFNQNNSNNKSMTFSRRSN